MTSKCLLILGLLMTAWTTIVPSRSVIWFAGDRIRALLKRTLQHWISLIYRDYNQEVDELSKQALLHPEGKITYQMMSSCVPLFLNLFWRTLFSGSRVSFFFFAFVRIFERELYSSEATGWQFWVLEQWWKACSLIFASSGSSPRSDLCFLRALNILCSRALEKIYNWFQLLIQTACTSMTSRCLEILRLLLTVWTTIVTSSSAIWFAGKIGLEISLRTIKLLKLDIFLS